MKILVTGTLLITMLAVPAGSFGAGESAVVEKVGATYALAMEGMT